MLTINPKNSILNQSDIVHTNVMSIFFQGLHVYQDFWRTIHQYPKTSFTWLITCYFFKVGKGTKDPSEGRTIHSIGNMYFALNNFNFLRLKQFIAGFHVT